MAGDLCELVLNRTWRPALSITGVGGLPPLDGYTQLKTTWFDLSGE
jgi:hypothetical protein